MQGDTPKRFTCQPVAPSIAKSSIMDHFLVLFGVYTVNESVQAV